MVWRVLEKLDTALPDVLVLDIIMPHLDGLGVLEKLVERPLDKRPKVIMLTAFGQKKHYSTGGRLGS